MKEETSPLQAPEEGLAQSLTIDWLRFPMALAVVFMHNFGPKPVHLGTLHAHPFTVESLCDFLRITLSHVATGIAVPCFFLFSGYLFFCKVKVWNRQIYLQKLQKRFRSLFIPYMLWILLFLFYDEWIQTGYSGPDLVLQVGRLLADQGLHLFWDSRTWATNYTDWLGRPAPMTGPALVPLWFLRDLMVATVASPLVYWAIRRMGALFLGLLGLCFLSDVWIPLHGCSVTCFFWFSAGAFFGIRQINMAAALHRFRLPAYVMAVVTLLPLIWMNGRRGDDTTTNVMAQWLYPVFILSGVPAAVSLAFTLVRHRRVKVRRKLAKATFFIFLAHPFTLRRLSFFFRDLNAQAATHLHLHTGTDYPLLLTEYLLTPLLSVTVCLLVYALLDRGCRPLLSVLTGSRK